MSGAEDVEGDDVEVQELNEEEEEDDELELQRDLLALQQKANEAAGKKKTEEINDEVCHSLFCFLLVELSLIWEPSPSKFAE